MTTAYQLERCYRRAGDAANADAQAELMRRKMAEVTEAADARLVAARSRLAAREAAAAQAQAAVVAAWDRARACELLSPL